MILASLKNLGAKTTSLFERKKKDVEQLAEEKVAEAQKLAEDQAKLAVDSLTKAKSDAEQLALRTGMKCFSRHFICSKKLLKNRILNLAEDSKNLAEGELNKAGESLSQGIKTADDKINQVNSTIDNTKQEIGGAVNAATSTIEQTKKAANDAINQGVKAAEQAIDDQVKHLENVKLIAIMKFKSQANGILF